MLIEHTIINMLPNVTLRDFDVFVKSNGEWTITRWGSSEPQPSKQAVTDYWNANEDAITESAKPKLVPNPIADLQSIQSDLIYQLMMNGVL